MRRRQLILFPLISISMLFPIFSFAQAWSGIIAPERATDWTYAGLPGDIPRSISGSWTQSGNTIAACGSIGSPVSPSTCGITSALASCGTNHYVLLGSGDFYLNQYIKIPSNCALRGAGAANTRIHASASGTWNGCNGPSAVVCLVGLTVYQGGCTTNQVPCQSYRAGYSNSANWTGGYSQGSTSITLDSVTGITPGVTSITLDQCNPGYTGTTGQIPCTGTAGAIAGARVYAGGSGYAVDDTGTIGCVLLNSVCYGGAPAATYTVTSVSGGAVTGFTISSGGGGYTTTNSNLGSSQGAWSPTTKTSSGGTGFEVTITGVTSYDNGSIFTCNIEMQCAADGSANTGRGSRDQNEVVVATAISGSGPYTVTLSRPLIYPNWAPGQSPQAWWGGQQIVNAGVEDIAIDESAVGGGISAVQAQNFNGVWVYGISSNTANVYHVGFANGVNILVASSYFYLTTNKGTTSYGVGSASNVEDALIENNIFQGIVTPINMSGECTGCVVGYNFSLNDWNAATLFLFASQNNHTTAIDYILDEGNIGPAIDQDNSHGPKFMDTYFRDYMTGYGSVNGSMPQYSTIPVVVNAFSRYNNILAGVFGTAGYHTVYQCHPASSAQQFCSTDAGSSAGNVHIYDIGFSNIARIDYDNVPATPNDLLTYTSTYRYGNYDVVNGSVQWNSSEVPTSDPNFPNSVPLSHAFPSSFYNGVTGAYASCGTGLSFWKNPTTGACPQYPAIGPEVTNGDIGMCTSGPYKWSRAVTSAQCAGGAFSSFENGGFGNSTPAMRCYLNQMGGPPDGTGSFLIFNRASCYASDPVSGTAPAPPTGLTFQVQ